MDFIPKELKTTNDVSDISQLVNDDAPTVNEKLKKTISITKPPEQIPSVYNTHTPVRIKNRTIIKSPFENQPKDTHSDIEDDENSNITTELVRIQRQKLKPIRKKVFYDNENNQNNLDISDIGHKETMKTKKEKMMLLLLKEKTKGRVKKENAFLARPKKIVKKERFDRYGTVINKKNKKKVKITFVDEIRYEPLIKVVKIESFKKYNVILGIPKEDKYVGVSKNNCQCCLLY